MIRISTSEWNLAHLQPLILYKCWHKNSAAVFPLSWCSQDKLWWSGFHQYEDRTRDSLLFCQALCTSCLVLDSTVHWLGSKKGSVSKALCRLPVWSLDSGNTPAHPSAALELQCRGPAEPAWAFCLSVHAATGTHSLCSHTSLNLCTQLITFFCVHRTDLIREIAKLSPGCVQLNSRLWPRLPRSPPCRPWAATPVPMLCTAFYPRKAPISVPAAC